MRLIFSAITETEWVDAEQLITAGYFIGIAFQMQRSAADSSHYALIPAKLSAMVW